MTTHDTITTQDIKQNDAVPSKAEYWLVDVADDVNRGLDAIEYQRAELPKNKQDAHAVPEGQFTGYDNRIDLIGVVGGIPFAVEHAQAASDGDLWEDKEAIMNTVQRLKNEAIGFPDENLDGKEEYLLKVNDLLEDTVELFEKIDENSRF